MNKLLKYVLIVNLTLFVLVVITSILNFAWKNYVDNYASPVEYDERGEPMVQEIPKGLYYHLMQIFGGLMILGIPLFVILISGIYLYKNPSGKEYFNSLLIPLSYILLFGGALFVWLFKFAKGEEGMAVLYVVPILLITFICVIIVNLIILLIKKNRMKN